MVQLVRVCFIPAGAPESMRRSVWYFFTNGRAQLIRLTFVQIYALKDAIAIEHSYENMVPMRRTTQALDVPRSSP